MKTLKISLLIVLFTLFAVAGYTQPPPPPGGSGGTGNSSSNKIGGSGPVGSGLFILLGLGAAYGGKKFYDIRKSKEEEKS